MTTCVHFAFRVDRWDQLGDTLLEHVTAIEDFQVAQATFEAACKRWPGETIGLPPEKWSSLMYGLWPDGGLKNGKEATHGGRDRHQAAAD
jgi:hypothetical protein